MANKAYSGYSAAGSIDGSADYFLISPNNTDAYLRINRSTALGISGSPVGTSDSQVLTNKTIGNTNTVTLKDTLFTLQDDGDATKQANFQLSGITTGNTRTLTIPDASTTLVGTGTTQTLTNKTFTSPAITGGTIDNSTITVDSIAGHTSSTTGTIYGIAVTSAAFTTNNIIPNNSLSNTGSFGSAWAWASYTPSFSNVTVNNGTVSGAYTLIGKTVFWRARFTMGSTSSITGTLGVTLPVTSVSYTTAFTHSIGTVSLYDSSATTEYTGIAAWTSTTTAELDAQVIATYVKGGAANSGAPMTWATGDVLSVQGFYEAA